MPRSNPLGPNLSQDLDEVLSADPSFKGSFYHHSTEPSAPNPCLEIDGIGAIGLPLSKRDAQLIIERADQASFGKGKETVVDKTVRDTWEIEAVNVSFNAQATWEAWLEDVVVKKVWASLGVGEWTRKPRCELYKLLLYQEGSHFLPHQDTPKANGMFTTVIIVLPSLFTGGAVHLSHSGRTATLDVSGPASLTTTSILGWYTDVTHEVKPVTSGFRLALSYNLIHTSPSTPPPALPPAGSTGLDALRRTLERWRCGMYEGAEKLYAYVFDHQYSVNDLAKGVAALKGTDAQLVAALRPLALELGFALALAHIKRHEWGDIDYDMDDENGWGRRKRYGPDEVVPMGTVETVWTQALNVVRIAAGGEGVQMGLTKEVEVKEEAVLPRDYFEDLEPDAGEYEGYTGNAPGTVEQWYQRSALLIYLKRDEAHLATKHGASAAVLRQLTTVDTPKSSTASRKRKASTTAPGTNQAEGVVKKKASSLKVIDVIDLT